MTPRPDRAVVLWALALVSLLALGHAAPARAAGAAVRFQVEMHDALHNVVTTTVYPTPVHWKITVTGFVGTPTGTVQYTVYEGSSCTGAVYSSGGTTALAKGVADPVGSVTPNPGTWSMKPHYSGNATYAPADGPCMRFIVQGAPISVSTRIHDAGHHEITSIQAGQPVHVQVIANGAQGKPNYSDVTVRSFTSSDCSGSSTSSTVATDIWTQELDGWGWDVTGFVKSFPSNGVRSFNATVVSIIYATTTSACRSLTVTGGPTPAPTSTPKPSHTATPAKTPGPTAAPGSTTAVPTSGPVPTTLASAVSTASPSATSGVPVSSDSGGPSTPPSSAEASGTGAPPTSGGETPPSSASAGIDLGTMLLVVVAIAIAVGGVGFGAGVYLMRRKPRA